MLVNLKMPVRWFISLSAKFSRVALGQTAITVVSSLLSQFSMLAATVLPLKLILLLGSETIPTYFPGFLVAIGRDPLIWWLSLIAVASYLFHLFAERLVGVSISKGVRRILTNTYKITLFANQEEVARRGFRSYTAVLSNGFFACLALSIIAVIYWQSAVLILMFALISLLLSAILSACLERVSFWFEAFFSQAVGLFSNFGFLLVFVWMVADFVLEGGPSPLVAIFTLLLARQIGVRLQNAIVEIRNLNTQRVKLEALFFHGKVFLREQEGPSESAWKLFEAENKHNWLSSISREIVDAKEFLSWQWNQSGLHNVIMLAAQSDSSQKAYLLKVFDTSSSVLGVHEATLLYEVCDDFPALRLLNATQIDGYNCLLFDQSRFEKAEPSEAESLHLSVKSRLLAIDPLPELRNRYCRSHPILPQRLGEHIIDRLSKVAEVQQHHFVVALGEVLDLLQRKLSTLPLVVVNQDLRSENLLKAESGEICLVNWGTWALEPLGSSWPLKPSLFLKLEDAAFNAAKKRPEITRFPLALLELSAISFEFEQRTKRQLYASAIELIPELLSRLDELESIEVG